MFSECFNVFLHSSKSEPRTGFFSREPDFQEFLKKPQNMFSWCFLSVSRYSSIVRNLSREPDFSAENRIFKNFSKSLKTCLAGVFWVFHGILALFDIWAENRIILAKNRIFKNFLKCLKSCLVGVFWVFQSGFSIVRHLSREPDVWAENRIFTNLFKSLKICLVGVFWVFQCIFA